MSNNNTNTNQREFEKDATGTQKTRKNDPLTEYSEKEPMTPAKIKEHEPTAVKRDPTDQKIVSGGHTGTDSPEALEEYRRQGMTKVSDDNASTISTSTISEQQRQNQGKGEPEQYKEEGYTEEKTSEVANTVKDSAESTFDKIKAGAKALGEKVINPNNNLEEEYNKEKSQ
ncbi:MAG TPA: hypothetical protein VFV86_10535 [Nitrososphaeraceae archaeon]|nr:hypothetical protein [Nitrososphaeraceae archaeon]